MDYGTYSSVIGRVQPSVNSNIKMKYKVDYIDAITLAGQWNQH